MTEETDMAKLHRLWQTAWWPVAKAIVATGHDCTILDPDAEEDETFFTGNESHGVIQVRTHAGLGWTVLVSEVEPDVEYDDE